jgi:hypothetical protein
LIYAREHFEIAYNSLSLAIYNEILGELCERGDEDDHALLNRDRAWTLSRGRQRVRSTLKKGRLALAFASIRVGYGRNWSGKT